MISVKFYNPKGVTIYKKKSKILAFLKSIIILAFFTIIYFILFKRAKFKRIQKYDLNQWKSSLKLLKKKKKKLKP